MSRAHCVELPWGSELAIASIRRGWTIASVPWSSRSRQPPRDPSATRAIASSVTRRTTLGDTGCGPQRLVRSVVGAPGLRVVGAEQESRHCRRDGWFSSEPQASGCRGARGRWRSIGVRQSAVGASLGERGSRALTTAAVVADGPSLMTPGAWAVMQAPRSGPARRLPVANSRARFTRTSVGWPATERRSFPWLDQSTT